MLNPNWLNTFVTLIDTGHFTKTAEKLFMTQPGVSQHINKLEASCGQALIHRDKKRFDLTEQGRLVYQYAQQLNKNEENLFNQLSFDNPYSGYCKLACSGALALILYPKLLISQEEHNELIIQLKAAPNQQILNEIQTGDIDLGIVTDMPKNSHNHSEFDVHEVAQEQLCLVLPQACKTEQLNDKLLVELGLINHPDAKHYLSLFLLQNQDTILTSTNIEQIPITGYVNQINQILVPVAKGLGFTVLPKSAVDSFAEPNRVKVFKPQQEVIETLYLVKKRNRELPARFELIQSSIKAHFSGIN